MYFPEKHFPCNLYTFSATIIFYKLHKKIVKGGNLVLRQQPHLASGQIPQRQYALFPALQLIHRHSPGSHHPPYLVVFTLADCTQTFPGPQRFQLSRQTLRSIPQDKALGEGCNICLPRLAFVSGIIDLRNLIFR